jgi:hypothetical protein
MMDDGERKKIQYALASAIWRAEKFGRFAANARMLPNGRIRFDVDGVQREIEAPPFGDESDDAFRHFKDSFRAAVLAEINPFAVGMLK